MAQCLTNLRSLCHDRPVTNEQILHTRHLVAIDLENLAGMARVPTAWAGDAAALMHGLLELDDRDLVYVAGSPHNGMAVCTVAGALHGQARVKKGHNGADLVLLEALESIPDSALLSPRAPVVEVVIVSGDGIFTEVSRRFRRRGLAVTAVARPECMHPAMATACSRVLYLDASTAASVLRPTAA